MGDWVAVSKPFLQHDRSRIAIERISYDMVDHGWIKIDVSKVDRPFGVPLERSRGGDDAVSGFRHIARLTVTLAIPVQSLRSAEMDRYEMLVQRRLRRTSAGTRAGTARSSTGAPERHAPQASGASQSSLPVINRQLHAPMVGGLFDGRLISVTRPADQRHPFHLGMQC